MKIAIIGAGWAGLAAAVSATRQGHDVTVFEASRVPGGRARAMPGQMPDGTPAALDNGQHILIGAYRETLQLMREVGVDPELALLRAPLSLRFADGAGLSLPNWPAPWDALAGIATARGWNWRDKLSLLGCALRWRLGGFDCPEQLTVAQLCQSITPRVLQELIAPLCVSALNTPAATASAKVFLRVLRDSLFAQAGGSNLLLPRVDLSALFPQAAVRWLQSQGAQVALGSRVQALEQLPEGWRLQGERFDAVLLAVAARDASRLLQQSEGGVQQGVAAQFRAWRQSADALQFEAITTVYAHAEGARLARPMLALRSAAQRPAQVAFDRGQFGGPAGLIAFVVSASTGERAAIEAQVLAQAREHLGLNLQALRSVTERRATFSCSAGLRRPTMEIASRLRACGDYVEGPYPATLEGAVRSALHAVTYRA